MLNFCEDVAGGELSISALAEKYGISERTVYRWKSNREVKRIVAKWVFLYGQALRQESRKKAIEDERAKWQKMSKNEQFTLIFGRNKIFKDYIRERARE